MVQGQVAAGEDGEVVGEHGKGGILVGPLGELLADVGRIDAGEGDVEPDAVDTEQGQGEEELIAQIGDAKDIEEFLEQGTLVAWGRRSGGLDIVSPESGRPK